jgi:hypothetical protein
LEDERSSIGAGNKLKGNVESQRYLPKEIVDPGGSWLPPAERCPIVQQWHGTREMPSGKFGPREIGITE